MKKHIDSMRIILVVIAALLMLSGCGAVFKSRYYKPSLPSDSHYSSKEWGNGLAVVTENICVWARETQTAYHQMISEGPLGLPVIPHDMSEQIPERSPIVALKYG